MDSEYSEFNFWKPVIPEIDLELCDLLSADSGVMDMSDTESTTSSQYVEENAQFNSFNFWKVPVPELDLDML